MKVENFISNSGNAIANQFIITDHTNHTVIFQSYNSIIVKKVDNKVFLDESTWDYSRTTGKYRNMFLGETIAKTRQKIESGEYQLVDLN